MGLDDMVYGTVRSSLLAIEPLPSLNRVYSTLIQEERIKNINRTKEEQGEITGLAIETGARMKGREDVKDKTMVCLNCNQAGHDASNCFQCIGYPD